MYLVEKMPPRITTSLLLSSKRYIRHLKEYAQILEVQDQMQINCETFDSN